MDKRSGAWWGALAVLVAILIAFGTMTHGNVRLALLSLLGLFAVVIAFYAFASTTPARVVARDMLRRYDRGRFLTWLTPYSVNVDGREGSGLWVVLLDPDNRSLAMQPSSGLFPPTPVNRDLRCEVKRYLRQRKYLCTDLQPMTPGTMTATFPRELTAIGDGAPRVVKGPYVIRWIRDERRRAIARLTVAFDGPRFLPHPVVRVIHKTQALIRHLRDMDPESMT